PVATAPGSDFVHPSNCHVVVVSYVVFAEGHATERCRLLAKVDGEVSGRSFRKVMRLLLPWGDLIMMRKQLLNLKRMAEARPSGRA
ncbi:MAG TPA: hypothetical protein VIW64_02950, partial [Pyrinomonadaceae bacterium]